MRFKSFQIKNFRGIQNTTLTLGKKTNGHINALVGLNESGKTTVLEAIHHFLSNPNLLKKTPSSSRRLPSDYQKMLPIGVRALFNGQIEIIATVTIEDDDWKEIESFLKSEFDFKETRRVSEFTINHTVSFEDSKHKKTQNIWGLQFQGKDADNGEQFISLKDDAWLKAANFVEKMLPKIVYFPSMLLEFPDRIVLEEPSGKSGEPRNDFYCSVLDDVLRAINSNLRLDTHLVERAKSTDKSAKENLDALLLQIGRHLKETVFSEWKKIFEQSLDYDFHIRLTTENKQLALEIKIVTKDGIFSINERSAGFRWFFAFIMLTRYRLHRKDRVLFLFDEPAANLHPNAQTQLIRSFELLAQEADIIYSTHSHYLINPLWLESTHIVRNSTASKPSINIDPNPVDSSIIVTPYKTFVGNHPEQYFYYRPIQEALDYAPSPLEFPSSVILVEGKTDFFALKYFNSLLKTKKKRPKTFPGGGAGTLDPLISLLYGWGKDFVVLLDSDVAGKIQKKRYEDKFEDIIFGKIFTLEDVNPAWKNYRIEQLIEKNDMELIRNNCFPEQKNLDKKHLHLSIQELIMQNKVLPFSQVTLNNFNAISLYLANELAQIK